jgi:hypothetical protein
MSKPILNTAYAFGQSPLEIMAPLPVISIRNPTTADLNYPIGQLWVNKSNNTAYVLTSVVANVANWLTTSQAVSATLTSLTVTTGPTTLSYLGAGGLVTNNSGVVSSVPMANGQLLIGNGATNPPTAATLTGGTGISITNGAGTITINATGTANTWTPETTSFNAAPNNGYVITAGSGAVTATLPTNDALGDTVEVIYPSATGGDILAITTSGARIRLPGNSTAFTTLTWPACNLSGAANPSVTLVCTTASATVPVWTVTQINGSPVGS